MSNPISHYLTPLGHRRDGRPILPIAGASPDDPSNKTDAGNGANEPPERPDSISETEWDALGDPGKAAIVRERDARKKAEADLARARTPKPTPPPKSPPAPAQAGSKDPEKGGERPPGDDIAALVRDAVSSAIKPFQEAEEQRQADAAAAAVQDAVMTAAESRLHDATDALTIDMSEVTDGNGKADATKIKTAIDELIERKPHLAKPEPRRQAQQNGQVGSTPGGATRPLDDRVKESLARMQKSTGLRSAG